MNAIEIIEADLNLPDHQTAVVELVNAYAKDPMGDGKPLADDVLARLIPGLREHPTTLIFLAYDQSAPIGIAVCFRGFSTFAARPLINVHDLAVLPTHRGQGVGRMLLAAVERRARELGCCKLTLEVLENNATARRLYAAVGFAQATYVPQAGGALFLSKRIR
jgi:GNAT superfamily N-acetyltransferase